MTSTPKCEASNFICSCGKSQTYILQGNPAMSLELSCNFTKILENGGTLGINGKKYQLKLGTLELCESATKL